mgnify:CR=1 FL=1
MKFSLFLRYFTTKSSRFGSELVASDHGFKVSLRAFSYQKLAASDHKLAASNHGKMLSSPLFFPCRWF